MIRIQRCVWIVGLLIMVNPCAGAQYDTTNQLESFLKSKLLQKWFATIDAQSPDRASIATLLEDGRAKLQAKDVGAIGSDAGLELQRQNLALRIAAIRDVESETIQQLKAIVEGDDQARLKWAVALFEYDRVRSYVEQMRLSEAIPDVLAVLDAVSIEIVSITHLTLPELSVSELNEVVNTFWTRQIDELNDEVADAPSSSLPALASCGVKVLRETAALLKIDLESVQAALICDQYPGLCARTPADEAYDAARQVVPAEAKDALTDCYNDYCATRAALRAIIAEAQQRWDQPGAKKQREIKRAEAPTSEEKALVSQKHPAVYAIRDLFRLERDTVASMRAIVPHDVLDRAPPPIRFALRPLE